MWGDIARYTKSSVNHNERFTVNDTSTEYLMVNINREYTDSMTLVEVCYPDHADIKMDADFFSKLELLL